MMEKRLQIPKKFYNFRPNFMYSESDEKTKTGISDYLC